MKSFNPIRLFYLFICIFVTIVFRTKIIDAHARHIVIVIDAEFNCVHCIQSKIYVADTCSQPSSS